MSNELETLAAAWREAKRAEQAANDRRVEIEAEILKFMENKEEGTASQKLASGGKVTVTYKLSRSVDTDALKDAWAKIGPTAQSAFKWKADVSTTEMKKLSGDDLAVVSQFVTTKPAKPAVKVEI